MKPTLKMTQVPMYRVHHTDLEAFIERVYGFEFDFLLAAGVTEGIAVDYQVRGEEPTTASACQKFRGLRENHRRIRDVGLILNAMAMDGHIPVGYYTVWTKKRPGPTAIYTELLKRYRDPDHPVCVKFRAENTANAEFVRRAGILDEAVQQQ